MMAAAACGGEVDRGFIPGVDGGWGPDAPSSVVSRSTDTSSLTSRGRRAAYGDAGLDAVPMVPFPDAGSCVTAGPYGFSSPNSDACAPAPPDDLLYFDPPSISAPAGGYSNPYIIASGPWAEDPAHPVYVGFDSFTLPTTNFPYTPSAVEPGVEVVFLLPMDLAVGERGTLRVFATNGPITKFATLPVTVAPCAPLPQEEACQGATCDEVDDGCGGKESCGTCGESAPYCFRGIPPFGARCITCEPKQCDFGEGFDGTTCACISCGQCKSIDNVCVCPSSSGPPPPGFP
jgi:hypothetical protein